MISKQKLEALDRRLAELKISADDLTIKAVLGSGPGGQKINKSASTIYVKHHPTGIEVKCGKERSRSLNHYRALQLLCDKIEAMIHGELSRKAKEIAKIRKQKQRRSRKVQKKLVEDKRQLSQKKQLRKSPHPDSD